jgi:hypothetical protein
MKNKARVETDVATGDYIILNTKGVKDIVGDHVEPNQYPNRYKIEIDEFGAPIVTKVLRCYG